MLPNEVEEGLLERDLMMLRQYANRHLLPTRRLQLQMMKIAQYVHADPTRPLSFYDVLVVPPVGEAIDDGAEEVGSVLAAVSGGNVIKLGQGRKKKG